MRYQQARIEGCIGPLRQRYLERKPAHVPSLGRAETQFNPYALEAEYESADTKPSWGKISSDTESNSKGSASCDEQQGLYAYG